MTMLYAAAVKIHLIHDVSIRDAVCPSTSNDCTTCYTLVIQYSLHTLFSNRQINNDQIECCDTAKPKPNITAGYV